ncbi:hypothetical protein ACQP3J_29630, partial [Escherichia coli]
EGSISLGVALEFPQSPVQAELLSLSLSLCLCIRMQGCQLLLEQHAFMPATVMIMNSVFESVNNPVMK